MSSPEARSAHQRSISAQPGATTLSDDAQRRAVADAGHGRWPLLVHLLCADDLTARPWRIPLAPAHPVLIGRHPIDGDPGARSSRRLALSDPYASLRHTRLDGASGAWRLSDEGSTNGTWLDGRRLGSGEAAVVRDGALIEIGHTFLLFRDAGCPAGSSPPADGLPPADGDDPATLCPEWERELATLDRLARSPHPVLVEGESGVGKELVARALHERSGRRGSLVSLNCAALPDNLLEDELFGHVRGAFSGALTSRDGLIRAAHDGTLFLDEIGDMSAALQVRLLRVLEDHKVRPLGGEAEIAVDVRVVAATHRDLRALAATGAFRHDLLARLGLLPFRVPPLRERREDLGLLIRALLRPAPNGLDRVRFEIEALRRLLLHAWPLNVRELRAALLSAADLARGDDGIARIGTAQLPAALRSAAHPIAPPRRAAPEPRPSRPGRPGRPGDDTLRAQIAQLLAVHGGNVAAVARALGNKRTNVQRLIARLGIDRRGDGSADRCGGDANPDTPTDAGAQELGKQR